MIERVIEKVVELASQAAYLQRELKKVASLLQEERHQKPMKEEVLRFLNACMETRESVQSYNENQSMSTEPRYNTDTRPFIMPFKEIWAAWVGFAKAERIPMGGTKGLAVELRKWFPRPRKGGQSLYAGLRLKRPVGDG